MRWARTLLFGALFVFVVGVGMTSAASMTLRWGLPFVWVRVAPSSYAPVVYTVYPTGYATLETTGNTQWDGYQTWSEVYLTNNSGIRGWVEQGSLATPYQSAPSWTAPAQPQNPYPYNTNNGGWQQPQQRAWPSWNGSAQTYQPQGAPWNGNNGWNRGWRHP